MNKLLNKEVFFRFEMLIVITIGLLTYLFIGHTQPFISIESEPLLDAHHYIRSYLYFNGDITNYTVGFPFNTRVAVPFLASLIPTDEVIFNFKFTHLIILIASILTISKIHHHLHLSFIARIVVWAFLLFHWLGPFRFSHHEPFQVDTSCYLFFSLFILTILREDYKWLLIIGPLSILFKEALPPFLLVGTVYYFINKDNKTGLWLLGSFLISMLFLYMIRCLFPPQTDHWQHHSVITVLRIGKMIVGNPIIIIRWVSAFISCFGLLFLFSSKATSTINSIWFWLFTCAIGSGLYGGGDHSRIIFTGLPFLIPLLINLEKDQRELITLALLSIPFFHIYTSIPNFTDTEYRNWFPEYANWKTITMLLSYTVGVYFFMKVVKKLGT